MIVRPSRNNMHEFVAEENTCFFDICLPNYTNETLRKITFFKELDDLTVVNKDTVADNTFNLSLKSTDDTLRYLEYDCTPPKIPHNFDVADLAYIGDMKWDFQTGTHLFKQQM